MSKGLRYLMPSFPLSLLEKLILLRVSSSLSWKSETKWSLHNPRGNGEQSTAPLGNTQIYGARWEPSKDTEVSSGSPYQAAFKNLPAVLTRRRGTSWLNISECDTHLQGGLQNFRPVSLTLAEILASKDHGEDHLDCHHMALVGQSAGQTQS